MKDLDRELRPIPPPRPRTPAGAAHRRVERAQRPASDPKAGAAGGPASLSALARELTSDLKQIGGEAQTLARLRIERAKLATREAAHTALLGSWLAIVGIVITVAASILFLIGLSDAVSDLAGNTEWVGPLIVGGVGLASGWMGLRCLRRRMEAAAAASILEQFGTPPPAETDPVGQRNGPSTASTTHARTT